MDKPRFHKWAIGITLVAAISILCIFTYVRATSLRLAELEKDWLIYSEHNAASSYALQNVISNFGYDGFIHHYKNLILRKDADIIPKAEQSLIRTYKALADYKKLHEGHNINEEINQFQQIVTDLKNKFEQAKRLIHDGKSAEELDSMLQLDAGKATFSLERLKRHEFDLLEKQRIATEASLEKSRDFVKLGNVLIPFLMLAAAYILFLLRRILRASLTIQETRNFLDIILNATPNAILVSTLSGQIIRSNRAAKSLFGYDHKELQQKRIENLFDKQFHDQHSEYQLHSLYNGTASHLHASLETQAKCKYGAPVPVSIGISHVQQAGQLLAITTVTDISDWRDIESRLRLSQRVIADSSDAILITDKDTRIVEANEAFCKLTGYCEKEIIGATPKLFHATSQEKSGYHNLWEELREHDHWQGEVWDVKKNGVQFPARLSISAVRDNQRDISHYVAIYTDITKIKENEKRLERLAHFDQLTALPNRSYFHQRLGVELGRATRENRRVALLYIDLDGFKKVNDFLGHDRGDQVLQDAANRISQCVREYDTTGRLGGDEFAVILPNLDEQQHIAQLCRRIINTLTMHIDGDTKVSISASIGVAFFPDHGRDINALLKHADAAMYCAKNTGIGHFAIFAANMSASQ